MPIRSLLGLLTALALAGCPALWVDRGAISRFESDLTRPANPRFPDPEQLPALETSFSRETRIGLAGYARAVWLDPRLVLARVASAAARDGQSPLAREQALAEAWTIAFGPRADRLAVEIDWRFDRQFVSDPGVLDPERWRIGLTVDREAPVPPVDRVTLSRTAEGEEDFSGRVRLSFPARRPGSVLPLVPPGAREVSLQLRHPTGDGRFTWRLQPGI